MAEFNMDSIISSLDEDVNKKNEYLRLSLERTTWDAANQELEGYKKVIVPDQIAQVNKAYQHFEERATLNKLTDSFRTIPHSEIESKTKRSLAKTIERYARQTAAIQAYR